MSTSPSTELLALYTRLGASYLREGVADLREFARRLKEDLGEVRFRAMLDHVGGLPHLFRQSNRELEAGRAGESKTALADVNAHYSNFQPRDEGRFAGPPQRPEVSSQKSEVSDEKSEVGAQPSTGNIWERIQAEKALKVEAPSEPALDGPPMPATLTLPIVETEIVPRTETAIAMTKRQRIILTVGLVAFVGSAILPPWRDHSGILGPYALLTNAETDRLDVHRLLVEWIIIVAVTGVLLLLATKGKAE